MKVLFGNVFLKSARKLPSKTQEKLDKLLTVLASNPYHQLLHTKQLSGELTGYLSFRISREWRALFEFIDPTTIKLLKVAHRKDIYR